MSVSKTIGVLGGMGPYATLAFFDELLTQTPASKDWEHSRIVIDNNPHIPSRTRHLLYDEESPFAGMLASCQRLQEYPVDFIAVPCNSAAIFVPELQTHLSVPVLHICEVTANALVAAYPGVRRVAALGGYVTYVKRTYEPFLAAHGIELIEHGKEVQLTLQNLIESIKLGQVNDEHVNTLRQLIEYVESRCQAEAVILACTEFGCLPPFELDIPMIGSSLELARHAVLLARD